MHNFTDDGAQDQKSRKDSTPIECFIMAWLSFLAISIVCLLFLSRTAFSEGVKYLYHVEGDDAASYPVKDYLLLVNVSSPDVNDQMMFPNFLYKQDSSLEHSPPRVIEFYAPWCPHCVHFKPEFVKAAREVTSKQPLIKFHAISCVVHRKLCSAQNVSGYPTIKIFKEGSFIAMTVERFTKMNSSMILSKLGYDDMGKLLDAIPSERAKPPRNPRVNRIEVDASTDTDEQRGIRVIQSTSKPAPRNAPKSNDADSISQIARVIPFQTHEVIDSWHDAGLSFEFALKYGLYMSNGPLPEKGKIALFEWLNLLSKTLPTQMVRTHIIIDLILENFSSATNSLSDLMELISSKFDELNSSDTSWRTCTYGDNKNGYTCGLWQLFHIMTLGVVEHNRQSESYIPTRYVAETLRNYIENFFQCEVCRVNFLYMYDSCSFDGCHRLSSRSSSSEHDWRELPLWLWETHNDVNVRLMNERLDRSSEPKPNGFELQQTKWPSLYSCPNCWREDKSWDDDEIYQYLFRTFWAGNPTYIKLQNGGVVVNHDDDSFVRTRSRLFAGSVFALILALVLVLKSKQMLTRTSTRRKKKF